MDWRAKMLEHWATGGWVQVDGDMNPGTYGGTIARLDGDAIEILEIQPVRAYVGDGEAAEVGYPFWTRESYHDPSDIGATIASEPHEKGLGPMTYCDLRAEGGKVYSGDSVDPIDPPWDRIAVALARHQYGECAEEGPSGWAGDICPDAVLWWGSDGPVGAEYLSDEDDDFRREVLGERDCDVCGPPMNGDEGGSETCGDCEDETGEEGEEA